MVKTKTAERQKAENVDKLIVDLAKQGNTPAMIGQILKEKQGIENIKALGKKITKILEENNVEYDDDLAIVNKKIKSIETHYNKNKQDKRAKREIVRFIGLRRKLEKYKNKQ
jgi:ribosomal protein S15P/S13E